MSKGLRDLEKRLQQEPDNLGLRITVASALREAGRQHEAVELYRSVAIAYRDQGRAQQALAVCRSILEVAPDDLRCHALIAALSAPPERRSPLDETPLPRAMPHHVADPTASVPRISRDLPVMEGADTRPGSDDRTRPETTGLGNAARRISRSLIADGSKVHGSLDDGDEVDVAAELDTREVPRIATEDFVKIIAPPPTVPVERVDVDEDAPTLPPDAGDTEEELTRPRDLVGPTRDASEPLGNAFFAPLPAEHHTRLLGRFRHTTAAAGAVVIRRGETGTGLMLVVHGELDVRGERADGRTIVLATIAPGDFIGEIALLAHAPSATELVARTAAELWMLAPRDFYEVAGAFPALWARLKDIAERRKRAFTVRLEPGA